MEKILKKCSHCGRDIILTITETKDYKKIQRGCAHESVLEIIPKTEEARASLVGEILEEMSFRS